MLALDEREMEQQITSSVDDALNARLFNALEAVEQRMNVLKQSSDLVDENREGFEQQMENVVAENTALMQARGADAQQIEALKKENKQLHKQLTHVTTKLDAAIGKIGKLLED